MTEKMINQDQLAMENQSLKQLLQSDYDALGSNLARRGIDIDAVRNKVQSYGVAVPSWGAPGLPGSQARVNRVMFSTKWKTAL